MASTVDFYIHQIRFGKTGIGPVREANISLEAADGDYTVVTPATGNSIFIVGILFSETNPVTLEFKLASGKYRTLELSAYQGVWEPVSKKIIPLPKDTPLIVKTSADISDLSIFYVEAPEFLL